MKAMILAAGEGRRMRPLTLEIPKPLINVAGKTLIEHQIQRLAEAGVTRIVINVSYLGQKIIDAIGNGNSYGVSIQYSIEPEPLETAGAISLALPLLGDEPFILINGDIWHDYSLSKLTQLDMGSMDAYVVLTHNPEHNTHGDYGLSSEGLVKSSRDSMQTYTFSGISVIHPRLVRGYPKRRDKFPLKEVLDWGIERETVHGDIHTGLWLDIGTPDRLHQLQQYMYSR